MSWRAASANQWTDAEETNKDKRETLSSPGHKAEPLPGQGMGRAGQSDLRKQNKVIARIPPGRRPQPGWENSGGRCKVASWSLWLVGA